jgi:UDP-N-acetylmuramate--alanine ligase
VIHLVGIGGVGMSAIARVLAGRGLAVSGCDRTDGPALEGLRALGIGCAAPHDAAHLAGVSRLVVSTAIDGAEPELVAARAAGIPVQHRADALASILADHDHPVVVTGAHGKTTTSAMLAVALDRLGLDPTFLVGGDVRQLGTNARAGSGAICVAEGDESDRSVARLPAEVAVVLNVDLDHLDHYASVEEVVALLAEWTARLPRGGTLVLGDGVELPTDASVVRFGVGPGEGLRALDVAVVDGRVAFRPSRGPARVVLGVGGVHNAGNACAAACVLESLGVPLGDAFRALEAFAGAGRRFEQVGERDGYRVVDDYAHHPVELAATIATARAAVPARLVVYFQPHMPWRTRAFAAAFADALAGADVVVLSETYVARGRPEPDASAWRIVEAVRAAGGDARWAPTYSEALAELRELARPGDLVVCAGAGPVDQVARALADA